MSNIVHCYYCDAFARTDRGYSSRPALFDLGSQAPRCALHWRYLCGACAKPAHFMSSAYCPQRSSYFCSDCATATATIDQPFAAWSYSLSYQSPWSASFEPALDRLEFDGRHPGQRAADSDRMPPGLSDERFLRRKPQFSQSLVEDGIDTDSVRESWNKNARRWDLQIQARGDQTRRYFSDGPMLRMLGEVAELDVLDLGCGNGYLSRSLSRSGARVTGIDMSEEMLAAAQRYEEGEPLGIRYRRRPAAELAGIDSGSFDLIVSNYVLQDVADYLGALREARRVLRPGGRAVLVITHPCFSCGPREWQAPVPDSPRPEELAGFAVDHYFRHDAYLMQDWEGFSPVPYFHRPLRDYWRAFDAAGFTVADFDEPSLNETGRAELPAWQADQAARVPLACIFQLTAR